MFRDTELIHQDDICDCGASLDCWEGDFPEDGYRYTKWICQHSCIIVVDRHVPILKEQKLTVNFKKMKNVKNRLFKNPFELS
ncbi:MAG: hypothetical protein ACJAS1_000826 [Oleiphilaceae bacterium]